MNALAQELNDVLQDTVAERLFSDFGQRIYFPRGIVAQTAEANRNAHRFNATVGMAFEEGEPLRLPSLARFFHELSARETVAYAPTPGVAELRSLWRDQMLEKNPSLEGASFSLPMVTPGLTGGLLQAADLFVDPGDAVVLPELFWGNYRLLFVERRGAELRQFTTFDQEGGFNVAAFRETVLREAQGGSVRVLLNFPNNPTGYTPTEAEAAGLRDALVEAAEGGAAVLVMIDDAYFGLTYEDGLARESLFASLANAHRNILACKVDGATKEDFAWGFRVGFVTLGSAGLEKAHYDTLEQKLKGSIRSSVSNSNSTGQHILLRLLREESYQKEKEEFRRKLERRYAAIRRILEKRRTGRPLEELPFNSGYFMSFACNGISAEQLRRALLEDGIGTIAIGERYLRVAYSTVDEADIETLFSEIFAKADALAT
jgi:aspartate/methionine/tyrosine aminotransferase